MAIVILLVTIDIAVSTATLAFFLECRRRDRAIKRIETLEEMINRWWRGKL